MKYDQFQYIRDYYRVEAYKGKRVRYDGKDGSITKSNGQYIYILFDGDKKERGPFHPTDGIEYLSVSA